MLSQPIAGEPVAVENILIFFGVSRSHGWGDLESARGSPQIPTKRLAFRPGLGHKELASGVGRSNQQFNADQAWHGKRRLLVTKAHLRQLAFNWPPPGASINERESLEKSLPPWPPPVITISRVRPRRSTFKSPIFTHGFWLLPLVWPGGPGPVEIILGLADGFRYATSRCGIKVSLH